MKRPENLQEGSKVRIVAPCGVFDPERFKSGVQLLEKAGFTTVFDDSVFSAHRYLAGDDDRRRAELIAALEDPDAKAIWVARGGYGATRLVDQIPVEKVAEGSKWLIGFSDVTALHALWARAGVQSIHGANITTLGDWGPEARSELYELLSASTTQAFSGTTIAGSGEGTGTVLGGNLAVLTALIGTGQLPDFRGSIVLLEDIGERPYKLDRMLTQHRQAKTFEGASAVVVGQLTGCDPREGADFTTLEVVAENLAHLGVPVLSGVALGHEGSSRALTFGVQGRVDTAPSTFTIDRFVAEEPNS